MTGEPSYLELCVGDAARARAFYGTLLGWRISGAGGNGEAETGSLPIGIHDGDDSSLFEVFFAVDDLDVAIGRVRELGGVADGEVHDNPGFGRWIECADDQGVRFGLREVS
jgi:predicted enzyme related to lactoylglutathione lyase